MATMISAFSEHKVVSCLSVWAGLELYNFISYNGTGGFAETRFSICTALRSANCIEQAPNCLRKNCKSLIFS
jgi:hypothetical protein